MNTPHKTPVVAVNRTGRGFLNVPRSIRAPSELPWSLLPAWYGRVIFCIKNVPQDLMRPSGASFSADRAKAYITDKSIVNFDILNSY